jgi:hypothetical protein
MLLLMLRFVQALFQPTVTLQEWLFAIFHGNASGPLILSQCTEVPLNRGWPGSSLKRAPGTTCTCGLACSTTATPNKLSPCYTVVFAVGNGRSDSRWKGHTPSDQALQISPEPELNSRGSVNKSSARANYGWKWRCFMDSLSLWCLCGFLATCGFILFSITSLIRRRPGKPER